MGFFMALSEIVLCEGNCFSMNIKYVMVVEFFQCYLFYSYCSKYFKQIFSCLPSY